jgi:hypothetical protein
MFPYSEASKRIQPVNIELPKPIKLQLRVVIKNTKEVLLDDRDPFTGERTSDIYVKGWLGEAEKNVEKTDVHYKSKTGEGNFNWRFIFDFEYLVAEKKILVPGGSWLNKKEQKEEPILHLEVWDKDFITGDDFIGQMKFNLLSFMQGTKLSKTCDFKKIYSKSWRKFNLFNYEAQKVTGWWPFLDYPEVNLTVSL